MGKKKEEVAEEVPEAAAGPVVVMPPGISEEQWYVPSASACSATSVSFFFVRSSLSFFSFSLVTGCEARTERVCLMFNALVGLASTLPRHVLRVRQATVEPRTPSVLRVV